MSERRALSERTKILLEALPWNLWRCTVISQSTSRAGLERLENGDDLNISKIYLKGDFGGHVRKEREKGICHRGKKKTKGRQGARGWWVALSVETTRPRDGSILGGKWT